MNDMKTPLEKCFLELMKEEFDADQNTVLVSCQLLDKEMDIESMDIVKFVPTDDLIGEKNYDQSTK